MNDKFLNTSGLRTLRDWILQKLGLKQDVLVSGINIKTINNQSLLGGGNFNIEDNKFIVTLNETPYQLIKNAIDANKLIVITTSSGGGYLTVPDVIVNNSTHSIDFVITDMNYNRWSVDSTNTWENIMSYPYQQQLTSGENIKTINNQSILGSGNIDINPPVATDIISGTIKLNPSESVTLNSDGQLDVGGRLGQMPNTTGVYSPKTISPQAVGNGSFLLTEASGLKLGNKSLAVVTGSGLTLKTAAAAGATTYLVTNNYENRIICAGIVGGVLALDEASAAENYVNITSVTISGYAPTSAYYWTASGDITITTDASINPSRSTTSIRPYCSSTGFSNFSAGQQAGGDGGASVIVGQKIKSASGNACALVGASIYNTGNGNAVFGRQHISRKNRSFLAGTGHDTTNGPAEGVAAFGKWSDIKSDTSFAIGNGTSATDRSNSFEIDMAGGAFFSGYIVLSSPNGTQYKVSVDDSGNLVTSVL